MTCATLFASLLAREPLRNKVAIVSGGARGMGAAQAKLFAHEGAMVVIGDVLNDQGLLLAQSINDEAGAERAHFVHLDVRDADHWERLATFVEEKFAGIDILVNNAAIMRKSAIVETSQDEWDSVVDVNLKGSWLGMRAVIPAMRRRGGGSIVNISSVGGLVGSAGHCAYHASKAGVSCLRSTARLPTGATRSGATLCSLGPFEPTCSLQSWATTTTIRPSGTRRFEAVRNTRRSGLRRAVSGERRGILRNGRRLCG